MRGAGGCPRPSAESLGGGRAERRRAVRVPGPGEVRKRIEYAMMLREKGISIREENPEDRRTIGRVVERAFRAEERSDPSGASARGAFARFGGIRSPALSGRRMRRNRRRLRFDERSADRIGRELRNFFGAGAGGGASGVSAAGNRFRPDSGSAPARCGFWIPVRRRIGA